MKTRTLEKNGPKISALSLGCWAFRSSTAAATTKSPSPRLTERWNSASTSSTRPTSTAHTRTRSWSGGRSRDVATKSFWRRSSGSCAILLICCELGIGFVAFLQVVFVSRGGAHARQQRQRCGCSGATA
jgi:hypothetical protein